MLVVQLERRPHRGPVHELIGEKPEMYVTGGSVKPMSKGSANKNLYKPSGMCFFSGLRVSIDGTMSTKSVPSATSFHTPG